ncbi:SAM-dependent chlorinase/fluorinase [bacterium]|nr:SAM-dependent chlorinase/fluorinase [bacterium]
MSKRRIQIITLLTDFGTQDTYVAEMKGTILSQAPAATIVDISHAVSPFAIEKAARMLPAVLRAFPGGTIHVVVIDPGVGGKRKPIIVASQGQYFIGPDNGLFTLLVEKEMNSCAYEIKISKPISTTFHGRDVFSPVAAQLALGQPVSKLAKPILKIVKLTGLQARKISSGVWEGKTVFCDHFGNIATNIPGKALEQIKHPCLMVGRKKITNFQKTFCTGKSRQLGVIINSEGYLEIMIPKQSAQKKLALRSKNRVILSSLS